VKFNFKILSNQIQQAHSLLQNSAVAAVNKHITFRNFIIGYYIVEYEQKGEDRAKYGDKLLEKLEINLTKTNIKGLTAPELSRYRKFYTLYPTILQNVIQQSDLKQLITPILGTVSQEYNSITAMVSGASIFKNTQKIATHYNHLFNQTSFSHFVELIKIDDITKRNYYELLILQTQPSVRELRKSINTLSYERTGLSNNKKLSFKAIANKITPTKPVDAIKDFYFFNFVGLESIDIVDEKKLETALLSKK
jgi:hypothetical protein